MASWTTPKTWTDGAVTAAEMNTHVRDDLTYLKDALTTHGITSDSEIKALLSARYGCSFYNDSVSCATGTDVAVNFSSGQEEWMDFSGMHSDSAQARFYLRATGTVQVIGWAQFAANADGRREVWITKNDATTDQANYIRIPSVGAGASTNILTVTEMEMTTTDYLKLLIRQSSGSTLSCSARFTMRRVGS